MTAGPWIKYAELEKRGFILLDVDDQRAHASWFHVADVEDKDRQALAFVAGFATHTGENHLVREAPAADPVDAPPLAPAT